MQKILYKFIVTICNEKLIEALCYQILAHLVAQSSNKLDDKLLKIYEEQRVK